MTLKAINHELNNKQIEVVNYEGEELLVKGIAGSGKTTVLLNRARKLIKENPSIKIGLFTYNKTLSQYAKEIAKEIGPDNLFVYTFHSWGYRAIKDIQRKSRLYMVDYKDPKKFIKNTIDSLKADIDHRFVTDEKFIDFLLEEISWMKGRGIKSPKDYISVSRAGRGSTVRVTTDDREIIYLIYNGYEQEKNKTGKLDYDDYANIILDNKEKIKDEFKFDQVMIDEGQDLQLVQLKLLRYIAKDGFAVAADKGQKIYKTSFAWKEIGINILGGRTKVLQNSFRSTQQIIQMAHSLQLHDSIIKDEEYVEPILPEYTGPIPDVYACSSRQQQDEAIISNVKKLMEDFPDKTIGILSREWRSIDRLYYSFQAQGIPHEFIKKDKGNILTPGIKLTSFHSAKGLEFDYVIILDLNDTTSDADLEDEEYMEVERRLLYVSLTRAKTYLQLYFYQEPSNLLKEINSNFYNKHNL